MKEDKFINENADSWRSLETTLKKLRSKGFQKFDKNGINQFVTTYNRVCAHLSYSRTYFGETETTVYLNRLVASAHSYIYSSKSSTFKSLINFFVREFPLLLRKNILFLIISTSIFLAGSLYSFIFTMISPDNASAFLPPQFSGGINLEGKSGTMWDSPVMSSYIMTNNIKVGFFSFAFGITLGIGTVWVLVNNSFMIGGLAAFALQSGANMKFWSLILPHGILELFAIFVCGASGLMIGYSLINPGPYSRKDSFILRGKAAIKLVGGTIPIFVIAGLIEGFITPMSIPEVLKLLFALLTLVLLVFYLVYPVVRYGKK